MNRKLFTILGLALFLFCSAAVQAKPREKAKATPFKFPVGAKATLDTVFFDNFETDTMGWDTMDMATQPPYWHIDTYCPKGAYDGHHWWCGTYNSNWVTSPGYGCGWVQMMVGPSLDLTAITTDSVQLGFYHYYSVEPQAAGDWDCVNLWITTDGGTNWSILYPDTIRSEGGGAAKYNLTNSYAWSFTGMVPDWIPVPGWGGTNNSWKHVVFDLTAYKGLNIQLRFATVSDPVTADEDAGGFNGAWYVDNISVDTLNNGGTKGNLFYDDCESGNIGWVAGSKPPKIHWHRSAYRANSGTVSWYCGDEATHKYSWGYSDAIVSPYIDLTPVRNTNPCIVNFKIWPGLDDGTDGDGTFDNYTVDITIDSGNTWVGINPYIYIDNSQTWSDQSDIGELDISGYIGNVVKIRIGVSSDGDLDVGEGLYIDDFIIWGKTREPLPPASTICLIDNDGNATDEADNSWTKYMESSLANLGYKYSLVTIGSNKVMPLGYLEQYPLVIWNLGPNYDFRLSPEYLALTESDKICMLSYLNNGGNLWLSGQYYLFANGTQLDTTVHPNLWMDYLHLAPENGWAPATTYGGFGVAGDPISDGLADSLLYDRLNGGYPWTGPDKAYSLNPDTANHPVTGFMMNDDSTFNGLRYQDAGLGYKLIYTSFPYEAVSNPEKRDTLMARVINWFKPGLNSDYMPPLVPQGLTLVQNADTVKCLWQANSEADLKGYNVYRSLQSGIPAWVKVGTVLHPDTIFADITVQAGLTYNYAVTAYDTLYPANESLKSLWSRITVTAWKLGIEGQPVSVIPARFSLEQNKPNPFKGNTEIRFALPAASRVELGVYNVAGQKVSSLVSGDYPAGYHSIRWNGKDGQGRGLSNGVYFYRLEARGQNGQERLSQTKRLIIVK